MSPVQDEKLVVRAVSDGTFAADSSISVEINGTPIGGLALAVIIPAIQGSLPSLTVDVHASSTSAAATTDPVIASRYLGVITQTGKYIVPFTTNKRSVCFAFRIGGGSTPSFSLMTAYITSPVGFDWDRSVEFV